MKLYHTCVTIAGLCAALPLYAQESAPAPTTMAAATPGPRATRIAVYQLEGRGVSERVAAIVTDSLVVELRKLERLSGIGMDEIADMLTHEENKRLLGRSLERTSCEQILFRASSSSLSVAPSCSSVRCTCRIRWRFSEVRSGAQQRKVIRIPVPWNSYGPTPAYSARPGSTSSQNSRLPLSSPTMDARIRLAYRSVSVAEGPAAI